MPHFDLPHKVDRALVKELCRRSQRQDKVINITKTVREASVVVEHKRYVDDPPSEIERHHVTEDAPAARAESSKTKRHDEKRVT